MADPAPPDQRALYDQDFLAWSQEQAGLLKARSGALDWDNLAGEVEALGRSERGDVRNRLAVVLVHLLKWQFQPSQRRHGWSAAILESRDEINRLLKDSPSLRSYASTVLGRQYEIARFRAADETHLPLDAFPRLCPYAVADIIDDGFFPGQP